MDTRDAAFMQSALREAEKAATAGEIPVGAVLTMGDEILAAGQNRSIRDFDPSAHAEVVALRAACHAQSNHRLGNATLYVTLEPCAMCVGALVQARVNRLVFGAYDPKAGAVGSAIDLTDSAAFNHRFEVLGGVLADESGALLQDFFRSRR
ncbi:MAG: tRNA adenosine(34) deaminase TadA [Gammaproteobacteria bacterium]|nr:tRNA adenosine(34) deaminase TadA [Gammaproteobacteria bacterium]MDH3372500.1 tRNA adenosine(34) deaminase TadA [Gammaproteobacteria bacterium]MDH3410314.1 tRNA adenosine(34) deaminase TadA [Gammaproteobacteria bacterium]MDH3551188.1 tRNA adenosine(34) deaminase TadA [Gammaproteobacteria bacterium]